jgi:hypothetical protein
LRIKLGGFDTCFKTLIQRNESANLCAESASICFENHRRNEDGGSIDFNNPDTGRRGFSRDVKEDDDEE